MICIGLTIRKELLPDRKIHFMKKLLFQLLLLLVTSGVLAQKAIPFERYLKKKFDYEKNVLPYRILYPDNYDKNTKYPLVLFLHGAGLRGNDNEQQLMHGAGLFLTEKNQKKYPAIVVVPQCPADLSWSSMNIDRSRFRVKLTFDYTAPATWPLKAANELVKGIADTAGVDKSRIYITGFSMGGMGTFESIFRYPDLYTAALPICGGGDAKAYDNRIKNTSFWIFHGADDAMVDVKLSREMVARLKALKIPVKYTEYPGVNHNSWDNAFADPNYLRWMFMQKRE
jgi:predicted peptidase